MIPDRCLYEYFCQAPLVCRQGQVKWTFPSPPCNVYSGTLLFPQRGRFCGTTVITVQAMKEILLHLPDHAYERLVTEAAAVQQSPEQWILDRLSGRS